MKLIVLLLSLFFATISAIAKDNGQPSGIFFKENKGQVIDQHRQARSDIQYYVADRGLSVFVSNNGLHYQFYKPSVADSLLTETYRMDVELLGANRGAEVTAEERLPYYERYYLPQVDENGAVVYTWEKITYKEIYPNIDWVLDIRDGRLEHDFIVHRGGNPADIRLRYSGTTSLQVNGDGSLTATSPLGSITEAAPVSYQEDGREIKTAYKLKGNTLSFELGNYEGDLIIDPALIWGTYYGGTGDERPYSVAYDEGYVYMAGTTGSSGNIATTGSHQAVFGGYSDAFLVKFDTAGVRLWATYYGGDTIDNGYDIAVDQNQNIYLAGNTFSMLGIATSGSYQPVNAGDGEGFLAKFDSNGQRVWGTYFGGDRYDWVTSLNYDHSGSLYLCGTTFSVSGIATPGCHQPVMGDTVDNFLTRFDTAGNRLWATYYGGNSTEHYGSVCTDATGNVYLSANTFSVINIATPGSHQPSLGGQADHYIAKFNSLGQRQWGTYYGGMWQEEMANISYDGYGHIYLGGLTWSTNDIATPGSHQPAHAGVMDGMVVKFNENGIRQWGTYYGGWFNDRMGYQAGGKAISFDDSANVFFCGFTQCDTGIATLCSYDEIHIGQFNQDAFLVKMDSNGIRKWGTYYGGTGNENTVFCCTDGNGHIYMSMATSSTDSMSTIGSHQPANGGGVYDGFLAKFSDCVVPGQPAGINGLIEMCEGDTATYYISPQCNTTSYTWALPGGWTIMSSNDTMVTAVAGSSGNISITANSACGSSAAQTLAVIVNPTPVPVITVSGNLLGTGTYSSYQWYYYDTLIAGATGQTYLTTQGGHYTVTVTDSNGCTGTSDMLPLSVKETEDVYNIAIYPNPARDRVMIISHSKIKEAAITNAIGQVVLLQSINKNQAELNISQLNGGVYFLTITGMNGLKVTRKMVKE